ncbi:MAG TPA: sulfotransferase domain-containing protein [Geminicoccaceae bacterium]|nr:sulfotransferase domain-containing protein [Geminicoccaceae bacterium]
MRQITWLASYPKSGNTWLRAIVDRLVRPECPFDVNALGETAPAFSGLMERFIADHGIEVPISAPGEVRRYWAATQDAICSSSETEIFLKTHNVAAKFDCGHFPDPSLTKAVIYMLRDPRDVAISFAWHYRHPLGLAVAALCSSSAFNFKPHQIGRTELLTSWGEHVAGWTALKRFPLLVLRYEDLLANAEAEIRRIAGFLGKQASEKQVQDIAAATSFEQLRRQEAERGFREAVRSGGFFRVGKAQQWRDVRNQKVFQPLLDRFSGLMGRYGYLERGEKPSARRAARPVPPR